MSKPVTRTSSRAEGAPPLLRLLPDPVRSRTVPPPEPPILSQSEPLQPEPSRVMPGHLRFGLSPPAPPEGDNLIQIVDDMTQVINDHLQRSPVEAPEDADATTTEIRSLQTLVLGSQPRVISAEAVQQMIVAMGEGLKALQTNLSKEVIATRQTASLVHAQGSRQETELQGGFRRVERDTNLIATNTQRVHEQMQTQMGTLVAMDTALDRVLKDINTRITKVQETIDATRRESSSGTNDRALNDSLKAINDVLRSQGIKLDTIEELMQVVEERGSQTTREEHDPPTVGSRRT